MTIAFQYLLDYWSVVAVAIILLAWGVLESKGKKLRLWVVPVFTVAVIAANILTLR